MKKNIYITKSGDLKRKNNTIYFQNNEIKKYLPIENIDNIYLFSEVNLNTKLLNFLNKNHIPIHIFNYYGFYSGSFIPKEYYISGSLLVKQVKHYLDEQKRLLLAKSFVLGALVNIKNVLLHYNKHGIKFTQENEIFSKIVKKIDNAEHINELMLYEGEMWFTFYQSFKKFLIKEFWLEKRVKRPPDNPINALISFGNSLVYTTVLSEMYKTHINTTVSFLHEPFHKRHSLALDIAEIFKPILTFKIIFKLVNKKIIKLEHFDKQVNFCLLNEKGRNIFLQEYDKKLNSTYEHSTLKKKISLKTTIRIEAYKIIKHILEEKTYIPFDINKKT